jgi:hypothetical protein
MLRALIADIEARKVRARCAAWRYARMRCAHAIGVRGDAGPRRPCLGTRVLTWRAAQPKNEAAFETESLGQSYDFGPSAVRMRAGGA